MAFDEKQFQVGPDGFETQFAFRVKQGLHLISKQSKGINHLVGKRQGRGFVTFLKQLQIGNEILANAVLFKKFRGKKNHVSLWPRISNDLMNLFRTYKKYMVGKDRVFLKINHMFSRCSILSFHFLSTIFLSGIEFSNFTLLKLRLQEN